MIKEINYKLKLNELDTLLYKVEDKQFKPINLKFDFENNKLIINDKKVLKVENDKKHEYTYKLMKTKIKAIGGIDGLYKFIKETSNPNDIFNNRVYSMLLDAIQ